ncbi:MAG: hypothetical protein JXR19_02555 [Bacteroidia bacterium]
MSVLQMVFSLVLLLGFQTSNKLDSARTLFHGNMENESGLNSFIQAYEDSENPKIVAYLGVATTMKASHTIYPNSKLRYFNEGKKKIESSILSEPNSPEIRYSRLLVQLKAPSFLLYNSNISEDLNVFIKGIKNDPMSLYWKKRLISNLLATEELSADQQTLLNNLNLN